MSFNYGIYLQISELLADKIILLWGPATAATPSFSRECAFTPLICPSRIQFRKSAKRGYLSTLRFKLRSREGDVILRSNSFGRMSTLTNILTFMSNGCFAKLIKRPVS